MGLIDAILSLVGILIWLNWRSAGFVGPIQAVPLTLLSTIRRAAAPLEKRWRWMLGLLGLLIFEGILYRYIGSAVEWTPSLNFGFLAVSFRSDVLARMWLYSFLKFGLILYLFHVWLIFLAVINRAIAETDTLQRLALLHLGLVARWPIALQILTPFISGMALWLAVSPLLVVVGIIPSGTGLGESLAQSALIGVRSYLCWELLVIGLLFLYLLNSYIYFGSHIFWDFINRTGKTLVRPLRSLPLQIGKVDLAPLLMGVLVFGLARAVDYGLEALYLRLPR